MYFESLTKNIERNFHETKTIFYGQSDYQSIHVIETDEFGTALFLDNRFQTSSKEGFFYHEIMAHPVMVLHNAPQKILIIGGGDGGLLHEILKYNTVTHVDMVEIDDMVVSVSKKYLLNVNKNAFDDSRVQLIIYDGRKYLEEINNKYDIIILDLTDPLGPSKFLYTKEFYLLCKEHLMEYGLLTLHNDSPLFFPRTYRIIMNTLRSVFFNNINSYYYFIPGYMLDFAFSICSNYNQNIPSMGEIWFRMKEREVSDLRLCSPGFIQGVFYTPPFLESLYDNDESISTDDNPHEIED